MASLTESDFFMDESVKESTDENAVMFSDKER